MSLSKALSTETPVDMKRPDTKQLLADPLAHFLTFWRENEQAAKLVSARLQQRQSLETQLKDLQIQKGILSRQIGEARLNNQLIEPILSSMQLNSARIKQLNSQIKQLNQDILAQLPQATIQNTLVKPIDKKSAAQQTRPDEDFDTESITVSMLTAADYLNQHASEWNDYVLSKSSATIHHRIEWRTIHHQSYAHESLYFCARDTSNSIVGVLPLAHIKSRLFGNVLVSMPFFQRGGALADHPKIKHKLMQAAADHAVKMHVDHIEIRDESSDDTYSIPMQTQTHKVNMVLALPDDKNALWNGFNAKLRAQIRRADRENTQVTIGHTELLDDFYTIYSRNMRDLGSPVQSKLFIKNILRAFPENSWLVIIKLEHRPVSAGFLLGSADTLEIPLASTIRDVNHLSINMLLYWEILKFAIGHDFRQFDFGRSSINAGTYRFKRQWGAKPKQLYYHYWLGRSVTPPSLNISNPKYAMVIFIWKRLPVKLTQWLGPRLVRFIP